MTFYTDFRDALVNDAGVMAIANQVYRGRPSQEAPDPFVVFSLVDENAQESLSGEADLSNMIIQVDCWGADADVADTLWRAVKPALRAATTFKFIRRTRRELFDDDTGLTRVSVDLSVWHQET